MNKTDNITLLRGESKITISNEIRLIHGDCMDYMRSLPDNAFDLAVVDPPTAQKYARGKNGFGVNSNRPTPSDVAWDNAIPSQEYFDELRRVSRNQIIWCAIYYTHLLPQSKCWIVWDKIGSMNSGSPFADCELAWTSFNKVVRKFTLRQHGFISDSKDGKRIHPTQKPTELYRWLLENYADKGDKILDTHLGSGSSAIAAYDLGFEFTGIEIDDNYFTKALRRFEAHRGFLKLDI